MEYMTLRNGVQMPMLGFGVYQIDPAQTAQAVATAIDVGYRSIDTAQGYFNEEGVGEGIAQKEEMAQIRAMDLDHSLFIDFRATDVADMFVNAGKM